MKTSNEIRQLFPIGTKVQTHSRLYLLKGQTERTGMVSGYCDAAGSDKHVRVTWLEWNAQSSVSVNSMHLDIIP